MTLLNTQETAVVRRPDEALRPGRAGGGARPAAGGPARRAGRAGPGWAALAVCCLAQFMVVLDISIVNVALPQMKAGLHLSPGGEQWVVNAYTLTFAGGCSCWGSACSPGSACSAGWRRTGRG